MQVGFYCLYKRRARGALNYNPANEGRYQSYSNQPDCQNITGVLTQHAQWLTAAGIDHVVVRMAGRKTNKKHQINVFLQDYFLVSLSSPVLLPAYGPIHVVVQHPRHTSMYRWMPRIFRITTRLQTPFSCGLSRSCARCAPTHVPFEPEPAHLSHSTDSPAHLAVVAAFQNLTTSETRDAAAQVWADLRAQGIRTPEIAIWQRVPQPSKPFSAANKKAAIYPKVLNVYNDPRFAQVCGCQLPAGT